MFLNRSLLQPSYFNQLIQIKDLNRFHYGCLLSFACKIRLTPVESSQYQRGKQRFLFSSFFKCLHIHTPTKHAPTTSLEVFSNANPYVTSYTVGYTMSSSSLLALLFRLSNRCVLRIIREISARQADDKSEKDTGQHIS